MPDQQELQRMREELKKAYPDSSKIRNLPDHQVLAVYNRLKAQGKLAK